LKVQGRFYVISLFFSNLEQEKRVIKKDHLSTLSLGNLQGESSRRIALPFISVPDSRNVYCRFQGTSIYLPHFPTFSPEITISFDLDKTILKILP